MDLGLVDRVYLVTGGSRGLGRATAEVLVTEGARVVVSSRSQESVDEAVAALGDRAVGLAADNADPGTPDRLVARAMDTWGRLDGALISVGGPPLGGITEISDEQWGSAFDSVFMGAIRLARGLVDVLGEGGSIAFVLSTSVREPLGGLTVSNGLRPGLAMVAKELADSLGPRGIRVNGLLPGAILTDRLAEFVGDSGRAAGPSGRFGQPEEFGRVAAFLLSPAASYLNGIMVPVDGGATRSY